MPTTGAGDGGLTLPLLMLVLAVLVLLAGLLLTRRKALR
jgi:LPXTG-motif cell wall-anchored protein